MRGGWGGKREFVCVCVRERESVQRKKEGELDWGFK